MFTPDSPVHHALVQHQLRLAQVPTTQLFDHDPNRVQAFNCQAAGLHADFSKHRVDANALNVLIQLAESADLITKRDAMFNGEVINHTEQRQVLHSILRARHAHPTLGHLQTDVSNTLDRMATFVDAIHSGQWRGFSHLSITDVVNIGIGGSDLGPQMVTEALAPYQTQVNLHFVSNVDGADLAQTLDKLNPATTLFVVASKTFTTAETLTNARTARRWLLAAAGTEDATAKHFVAVSSAVARAVDFGITPDNIFPLWDWVGGRYSLWSAIGLPIALACGMPVFEQLLAGAEAMDQHFASAPLLENMPVIMAVLGIFYINYWHCDTHAILPYSHYLGSFTKYIQQLDMESNGKTVALQGTASSGHTGPIIWGEVGTNGQHSFHQLLHQGTRIVPVDFILPLTTPAVSAIDTETLKHHQAQLVANCLSQSRALMLGKSRVQAEQEFRQMGIPDAEACALAPHKMMPGNRPSTTITMHCLTPENLGALIALYEHKVFVQSAIWNINAFDQWGVELGKQLCNEILPVLTTDAATAFDPSTNALIQRYKDAHQ
ncbi:glucose-6-phosphate isomerase [Simiduia agarivorans]|uniref:Glucose-6-phosphate isomerase n=1 Tax=Simiduia agarivorans (strain DSM 21679 / JCM 13881 / BCRC 17597 / SA1) TaxID=1117647 RepID=K4KN74_SIMAS|nr:glucose-6-phosphate isomerase [Simiduia agarivorans]AFV00492.1 glucose-6-phosphate isomerase [Simiduia agarivorans SA1 = DSM 21679]